MRIRSLSVIPCSISSFSIAKRIHHIDEGNDILRREAAKLLFRQRCNPFKQGLFIGRQPHHSHRWLSGGAHRRDLMRPFPADLRRMWPISTRVNKPENDDRSIIEPIDLVIDAA
jgi:hypothetical protein